MTGALGEAWAARNRRARALLAPILPAGPGDLPHSANDARPGPVIPGAPSRQRLAEFARTQAEALLAGELAEVAPHLDDDVWVLWPDNTFARHPGAALAARLEPAAGVEHELGLLRTYAGAEARTAFARGIPEALDALFALRSCLLYAFSVEGSRLMLAVRPTEDGGRLASLLLPSVDEAWAHSSRAALDEEEPIRIAANLVRRMVLGHGAAIRAMRVELMDTLWLNGEAVGRDDLAAHADTGPHKLDGAERVFRSTTPASIGLPEMIGGALAKRIVGESEARWRRPLEQLRPMLVETSTVTIDPATRGPGEVLPAATLLLRTEEPDGAGGDRVRWRVGGFFH